MPFMLPDFKEMEDHELRRAIADLQFQVDVATDFLTRAEAERDHRKQDKKEGIFKSALPAEDKVASKRKH